MARWHQEVKGSPFVMEQKGVGGTTFINRDAYESKIKNNKSLQEKIRLESKHRGQKKGEEFRATELDLSWFIVNLNEIRGKDPRLGK